MKKGDLRKLEEKIETIVQSGKTLAQDDRTIRDIYLRKGIKIKKIILKSDSIGSLETIMDGLYNTFENYDLVNSFILQSSVGVVTEEEAKIAQSADCIIFTFNFDKDDYTTSLSFVFGIGIRMHKLVFNLIEEIKHYIYESLLIDPDFTTNYNLKSRSRIQEIFKIKFKDKVTNLAGLHVEEGDLHIGDKIRICDAKKVLQTSLTIASLKQEKLGVSIVKEGEECGVILNDFQDFNVGDCLDSYLMEKQFEGISNTKVCVACYT